MRSAFRRRLSPRRRFERRARPSADRRELGRDDRRRLSVHSGKRAQIKDLPVARALRRRKVAPVWRIHGQTRGPRRSALAHARGELAKRASARLNRRQLLEIVFIRQINDRARRSRTAGADRVRQRKRALFRALNGGKEEDGRGGRAARRRMGSDSRPRQPLVRLSCRLRRRGGDSGRAPGKRRRTGAERIPAGLVCGSAAKKTLLSRRGFSRFRAGGDGAAPGSR